MAVGESSTADAELTMEQGSLDRSWRILMLEDAPTDAELAERELRKAGIQFSAMRVETWAAFVEALETFHPDMVLSDYNLPDFDGMAALQWVQAGHPEVPVIMVTGALSDIGAVELLHAGAKDYVLKDGLARLAPAVRRALSAEMGVRARKASEKALMESEERFRSLVESSNDWIWEINADYCYTYVSPRVIDLLGYASETLMGKTPFSLMPEAEAAIAKARFSNIADQRKSFRLWEHRYQHQDGRLIYMETNGSPILDADGNLKGYRGIDRDISERKRVENELRLYKDQLEETVQQRTSELLLARDAAEAANKAKSVFLANMSHELRTPLNAILGYSSLLRCDSQMTPPQRDKLGIINRSGERLLNLINDVLDVAKIESGRLQLDTAIFDFSGMLSNVVEMMTLRAHEKGLKLIFEQSPECPRFIKGDEARLRQILINLVGNAVKFTERGSVVLRVNVTNAEQLPLHIEVEDSGVGISPEDQGCLFKPFMQLAQAPAQQGTGLGLVITQQFVNLMGGGISVDSAVGKGTRFCVELPLQAVSNKEALTLVADRRQDVVGLCPGQPRYRILIAEDHYENRLLLSRLMTDIGLEVRGVENGEECIQQFQIWHPDLIWMDGGMPIMDGLEAAKRIRQLPEGQAVKIVAITSPPFNEPLPELLAAGMNDVIPKSYGFDDIYQTLAKQLGLQYIYRSHVSAEDELSSVLTAGMLSALPSLLRNQLKEALIRLDSEDIAEGLKRINEIDQKLAQLLSRLVDDFNYPVILSALEACETQQTTNKA